MFHRLYPYPDKRKDPEARAGLPRLEDFGFLPDEVGQDSDAAHGNSGVDTAQFTVCGSERLGTDFFVIKLQEAGRQWTAAAVELLGGVVELMHHYTYDDLKEPETAEKLLSSIDPVPTGLDTTDVIDALRKENAGGKQSEILEAFRKALAALKDAKDLMMDVHQNRISLTEKVAFQIEARISLFADNVEPFFKLVAESLRGESS